MPATNYQKMIDEICALADIPLSQLMYQSADLKIDDIDFTVIEAGIGAEDGMALYCDFGPLPTVGRETALERLLQINLVMHGINTPVFTLNQDNGHVLLARRIALTNMTALDVMNQLAEHAEHAKQWRQTYYLRDPKQSSKMMGKNKNRFLMDNVAM